MQPGRTVIVKVGGSLYDLRDLGVRLTAVCRQLNDAVPVLFPGGGPTADLVRGWHEQFVLSEHASHDLAIHALRLNAQLLAKIVPGARPAYDDVMVAAHAQKGQLSVLDPWHRLFDFEQKFADEAPPHHWDVTSDSLAAWMALHWPAEELLLLKSVPCPRTAVTAASQQGLVDPYFPGLAGRLARVSWCNLRTEPIEIVPWLEFGRPAGSAS